MLAMHDFMLEIADLIRRVPDTVWAAVIAASIAFLTTILTNKNSRKQLRMQLQHEAQERERERAMALRRDVFLPAAEALIRGQQALGQVVNLDIPLDEVQKLVNIALAATSKISPRGGRVNRACGDGLQRCTNAGLYGTSAAPRAYHYESKSSEESSGRCR
jgi:hypothetical protein